jgi:hypothetical protein
MKRLTTTLGLMLLALGACGMRPVHAQVRCTTVQGTTLCADPGTGTYFANTTFGRIQGQCASGAKWDGAVPFILVNSLHTQLCGTGLNYVDR